MEQVESYLSNLDQGEKGVSWEAHSETVITGINIKMLLILKN